MTDRELYRNFIDVELKLPGRTILENLKLILQLPTYITEIMKNATVKATPTTQNDNAVVWHPQEIQTN